jgi:anti-anti-sigma factor
MYLPRQAPMTAYASWSDHGVGIVEVTGALDPSESVAFHAAIRTAVDQAQEPYLVIVCAGIGRMALGPIGVVITTSQALQARGGRVVLAGADARFRRVLRIGGITDINAFPDLESALGAVRADP